MSEDRETNDVGLLRAGAVLHGGRGRELVVATGADRVAFLHRIVTGNVAGTPAGGGGRSALLTLKGHVVADLLIFVRAHDVWILTPAGEGDATAAALSKYAIMDDVAFARQPELAQVAVLGPEAGRKLVEAGLASEDSALPTTPWAHTTSGDLWLVRARELGADGYWLAGAPEAVTAAGRALASRGVATLAAPAAEAARIAALEGRWGAEITPDYFPMEVGLSGAIDYTKGCYLGQEPIVRVRDRGHINWRLVSLDVEGGADAAAGDALESDVKPRAGRITSAARFPDGRGVALAMLHVSVPVGASVRIKHGDALVPARVRESV